MAWTAPMTATTNQTFTAAQWNTHVRDNFAETEAAKASTRGRYLVSNGNNALREFSWFTNYNTNVRSSTSTSYTDLSGGTGPQVGLSTSSAVLVFFSVSMGNETSNQQCWASVAVTGASTVAAADTWALMTDGVSSASSTDNQVRMSGFHRFTGLTVGHNVFTVRYRVTGGTGWFGQRAIQVMPL